MSWQEPKIDSVSLSIGIQCRPFKLAVKRHQNCWFDIDLAAVWSCWSCLGESCFEFACFIEANTTTSIFIPRTSKFFCSGLDGPLRGSSCKQCNAVLPGPPSLQTDERRPTFVAAAEPSDDGSADGPFARVMAGRCADEPPRPRVLARHTNV